MIALTVFLWTTSNFLASSIFADDTYSKPFLVTYVNTSFFLVPLVPILVWRVWRRPGGVGTWWRLRSGREEDLEQDEEVLRPASLDSGGRYSISGSRELLLGDREHEAKETTAQQPQLSMRELARLSLEFCFLWFAANYFVAASFQHTTVASSSIFTNTSGLFTFFIGWKMGVEHYSHKKLAAVISSLLGVILISFLDLTGKTADDEHRGDFPLMSNWEMAGGNALALISAFMYGLYASFMKKRIGDGERVNMALFFGLVGLLNVILLWPGFFLLHYTGLELFELPPSAIVTWTVLGNSFTSLVSDLLWAYAVLFTTPLVVTLGLTLTIPLSLIGQGVLFGQWSPWAYWIGALVVVVSFAFVSYEEKADEDVDGIKLPSAADVHGDGSA
ncbi:hypothetical protein EJ03DRAFT_341250 [Teratosphaeria nubilosa]|uniref:DUF3955 domain-containing protein n=1 Tax=Teratosphaeria nubilosa TaxID=161662 RepID=A0A6G1LJH0_9PEZI|nr:hypothetical protein EJ03DRAFT_341250 [Teratosphaeria nubilosa]